MNYSVKVSSKALLEIVEAWEWYEDKQMGLGDRFEEEFLKKINQFKSARLIIS